MVHSMGQLGLSAARDCGPLGSPCLLLLGEFPTILCAVRSTALSLQEEARLHLERAAFLHFAPARTNSDMRTSSRFQPSCSTPSWASNITRSPVDKVKSRPRTWRLRLPKRLLEKGWGAPSLRWGISTRKSASAVPWTLMQLGCGAGW